jgi:hypothetical protein
MGPKTGAQKSIPASLFPFLDRGNYSRGSKNGGPCHKLGSASAQAKLRFAHLQLRLKQQLLRSKDGNGNCSCRDSDVEFPVSQHAGREQTQNASGVDCISRIHQPFILRYSLCSSQKNLLLGSIALARPPS